MRRLFLIGSLFLLAGAAAAQTQPQPQPQPSSEADDVARHAVDNLAGPAWEKARYFAFSFVVEREGKVLVSFPQRWDRVSGDYRVSGKDPQGNDFLVIMNVNTQKGKAWQNGKEVADPKDLLALGYLRFTNDTYWLLMPLRAMDPGVHRELASPKSNECGSVWDVVKLTFDPGVGFVPPGNAWMSVNRDTGLVDQWDMKIQGSTPQEPPVPVVFHKYRRVSGLLISTWREVRGKNQWVHLDDLQIMSETPKAAFVP